MQTGILFSYIRLTTPADFTAGSNDSSQEKPTDEIEDKIELENLHFFYTEGEEETVYNKLVEQKIVISREQCTKVPPHIFGETIKAFIKSWDTQELTPLEIMQEWRLCSNFILHQRDPSSSINFLKITRENSPKIKRCISLLGSIGIEKISLLFANSLNDDEDKIRVEVSRRNPEFSNALEVSFEEQRKELKLNKLLAKDNVLVTCDNIFQKCMGNESVTHFPFKEVDQRISYFFINNSRLIQFGMLDPLDIYSFALAPTIRTMEQTFDYGGIAIIQSFFNLVIQSKQERSSAHQEVNIAPEKLAKEL